MSKERQILRFQGYEGSFTIESSSVVYEIIFQNGNQPSTPPLKDTSQEAVPFHLPVPDPQGEFYRCVSEEMYNKLGSLAKDLNSHLRDISLEDLKGAELPITGAQLEDARADLEGVVEMTETATNKLPMTSPLGPARVATRSVEPVPSCKPIPAKMKASNAPQSKPTKTARSLRLPSPAVKSGARTEKTAT